MKAASTEISQALRSPHSHSPPSFRRTVGPEVLTPAVKVSAKPRPRHHRLRRSPSPAARPRSKSPFLSIKAELATEISRGRTSTPVSSAGTHPVLDRRSPPPAPVKRQRRAVKISPSPSPSPSLLCAGAAASVNSMPSSSLASVGLTRVPAAAPAAVEAQEAQKVASAIGAGVGASTSGPALKAGADATSGGTAAHKSANMFQHSRRNQHSHDNEAIVTELMHITAAGASADRVASCRALTATAAGDDGDVAVGTNSAGDHGAARTVRRATASADQGSSGGGAGATSGSGSASNGSKAPLHLAHAIASGRLSVPARCSSKTPPAFSSLSSLSEGTCARSLRSEFGSATPTPSRSSPLAAAATS